MNVLFIDNYDSFTFNLVEELGKRQARVAVWRNDIPASEAMDRILALPAPRLIVLSPGPGRPEEAGCCQELVQLSAGRVPLFGVCLGLQAIVQAFGGEVAPAGEVVHGKSVWIEHAGEGVFSGLPSPILVGRYHSLAARRLPETLVTTASYNGLVMAIAHKTHPIIGVQFHPESILTPLGGQLIEHTLSWASAWSGSQKGDADG